MRIGTLSPKREKFKSLDVGVMKIDFSKLQKHGVADLILETSMDNGIAQYPKYIVILSENEIKEIAGTLTKTNKTLELTEECRSIPDPVSVP